jgi:4-amino-4-deoxy-L-arabinose transferase-like glycosyltransferase
MKTNRQKIKGKKLNYFKPEMWLILILIFAFFLRLVFFVGMGYNDDSYYLETAEKIYKGYGYEPNPYIFWDIRIGIIFPVVLMWKLFSINELSTSIFFILCSLGSIVVAYLIGTEIFNKKIGVISAFLLSIFPLSVIYATQVGPDTPFQFTSGLALFLFIKSFKNEKKNKLMLSFFSGIFLGVSYIYQEMLPLTILLIGFYIIWQNMLKKKKFLHLFKKESLKHYFLLAGGFLLIFFLEVFYFYSVTGQWFFAEKAKQYTFTHDKNSNWDLLWYPTAMFNYRSTYFDWIHDEPIFGFMYYFVVFSIFYLIYKKELKKSLFLILWFLLFFAFLEYGLQFFCTKIMDYCLYGRNPRYLSIFSIPAMILLGRFLEFDKSYIKKTWFIIGITFLTITSLFYSYQDSIFLGNGMNDIQETAEFIETLPIKTIYVPDVWSISKLKFFFKYNDTFVNNLKFYECSSINCNSSFYDNGTYISNAYVVTWLNPYNYINQNITYPNFMKNPPENWKLLKIIKLKNYGIFEKYDPKIFEVR